jgi:hypothetical protein
MNGQPASDRAADRKPGARRWLAGLWFGMATTGRSWSIKHVSLEPDWIKAANPGK